MLKMYLFCSNELYYLIKHLMKNKLFHLNKIKCLTNNIMKSYCLTVC